jgi:2'-hydroxyisoflavone reductase
VSRLLVVGGTQFLGRHLVAEAVGRGDEVTTLNRGVTGPDDPRVQAVHGDRTDPGVWGEVARCGPYDVVVDTCGYVPRDVLVSAEALEPIVGRYVLVSSISAHPEPYDEPMSAESPVSPCAPDAGPDAGDYGVLKAGCERAVTAVLGDRATVVRPGLILGPWESIGRLPWWLARMARGGEVLAPGAADRPFQAVDGRDLAAFCLAVGDQGSAGPYDVVSHPGRDTWGGLLRLAAEVTAAGATLRWVDDRHLLDGGVEPWSELPMWLPPDPAFAHFLDVDPGHAEAAGLQCRPLAETVADTWEWQRGLAEPFRLAAGHGISADKEASLLASLG